MTKIQRLGSTAGFGSFRHACHVWWNPRGKLSGFYVLRHWKALDVLCQGQRGSSEQHVWSQTWAKPTNEMLTAGSLEGNYKNQKPQEECSKWFSLPFDTDLYPTDLVIQEDFIFSINLNHKKVEISISADIKPTTCHLPWPHGDAFLMVIMWSHRSHDTSEQTVYTCLKAAERKHRKFTAERDGAHR